MYTTEKTRVHLIRHGEVEGGPRYNGHNDVGLSARGIEQYHQLKPRFDADRISACYTSDLTRTVRGGEILGSYLGVEPVKVPELREIGCGVWQGMTVPEIQRTRPGEWEARMADLMAFRAPGGETINEVAARALPALAGIVERHRGEEILVIAHGGVNRIILMDAIGAPLASMFSIEQSYCCMNVIDYYADGNSVVKLLNG